MKRNRLALHGSRQIATLLTIAALMIGGSAVADASSIGSSKKFGLGGILGQPTGFTIKYHFTPKHALTAAVGVGWWAGNNLHIHADYGYHFQLKRTQHFDFKLYLGGGLKFFFFFHDYHPYWDRHWRDHPDRYSSRVGLGIRVPIGIAFNLNRTPLEIFLEIVPGFAFLPWLDGFVDGGVGLRYYF